MFSINKTNIISVVTAHPIDDILGCISTTARHVDAGHQLQALIFTDGATARLQQRDRLQVGEELSTLAQATQTAVSILGVADDEPLDLPNNRLDLAKRIDRDQSTSGGVFAPCQ